VPSPHLRSRKASDCLRNIHRLGLRPHRLIDAILGEDSQFHQLHGFYVHGQDLRTPSTGLASPSFRIGRICESVSHDFRIEEPPANLVITCSLGEVGPAALVDSILAELHANIIVADQPG
jgi:hypothetical protein